MRIIVDTDTQSVLFEDSPGITNPEMGRPHPGSYAPPGQERPQNGHSLPQEGIFCFDWSVQRGIVAMAPDGSKWKNRTLVEFIQQVPRGSTIVGGSSFGAFDLRERRRAIDLARERDITFLTLPERGTARRRQEAGLPPKPERQSEKTDFEDAKAMRWAVDNGAHLKTASMPDPEWMKLRDEVRQEFIDLRRYGGKDDYARNLIRFLPSWHLQPRLRRLALGTDGYWSLTIVAAVGIAAKHVSTRTDFERLVGLFGHGYPSQFRSDLMHHGWTKAKRNKPGMSLSVYRRELRWLFHQIRTACAQSR